MPAKGTNTPSTDEVAWKEYKCTQSNAFEYIWPFTTGTSCRQLRTSAQILDKHTHRDPPNARGKVDYCGQAEGDRTGGPKWV
jgi:hypothetical protein